MTQASPLHAFLQVLADHALLGRLFFASVEMAVLAGIVWLIIRIRRRMSPRLCSILWLLVMAKALVALAIGAPLAIIRIHPPEPEPVAVTYEPGFDYEDTVPSFEPEATLPLLTVEPGPTEAARPAGWSFSWKWNAAETISGAWIIGAILVGLYAALNRVRLHRLVSRAMPPPAGIAERYRAAVKHLRVKRPPRLLVTHDLESPALVGTVAPAILLPAWMSEKPSDAQLDWSLRHELTHWKLGDPLADFVRQIARILFFFHPVTWFASRKWEESAELACDRVVVRTESEAENYAGELYQILAQIHGRRTRLAMGGLFATRTQIGRRIAALLSNPLKWPARLGLVATLCLAAVAVISCTIGGAFVKSTRDTSLDEIRRVYAERADAIRTLRLSWEGERVLFRDEFAHTDYPAEPRSLKKKGWLVIAGDSNRIEREMDMWDASRQDVIPGYRMINVYDGQSGGQLLPNLSQGKISSHNVGNNELVASALMSLITASYRKAPAFLTGENISILREEETPEGPRIVLGNTDYGTHHEIHEDTGRMRGTASSRTEWFLDPQRDYILTEKRVMMDDGSVVYDGVIDYTYQEGIGYVPKHVASRRRSPTDLSIVVDSHTLRVTGFRLNEPVDPKLFTLEFAPDTDVYDDRPEPAVARADDVSGEQSQSDPELKAMIKEAYWDKYQHLESYALHYSEESVYLDEETGAVIPRVTDDVEVLARGDDKAVRKSRLVPSTGRRAEVVSVATGGVYRSLMVYPDTGPHGGHIWTVSNTRKCDTLGTTPLAYSRLDSMRWPKDQVLHANGANNDMTVLMNLPGSRVLAEPVSVGGRECYVVERGPRARESPSTKLYLAKDLGLAVCKLEGYAGEGSSRFLRLSITFNDFAEVAPGLYMPREGELIGYTVDGSVDNRRRYHNMSLDLAPDIPDDAFVLEFPDGTEVTDEETMEPYISNQGQLVSREEFFASPPMAGKEAPELDVAEWVSGEPTTEASLRGKTLVLAFWDSRDEACAELVPVLNGLRRKYSERGVEIISIHSAEADTNALKKFISEQSISFRVVVDKPAKLYKGVTFKKYNVWKVPAVFIIDAEGKVRYQDIPLAAVEEAVKTLMEEADTGAASIAQERGAASLTFPPETSLGTLYVRPKGAQSYQDWQELGKAQGTVEIPRGQEVRLTTKQDDTGDLSGLELLSQVDLVDLHLVRAEAVDSDLRQLRQLTSLRQLTVSSQAITDDGLVHLKDLTSLENLALYGNMITGKGFQHIQNLLNLEALMLGYNRITDGGLSYLKELKNLRTLWLPGTQVTDIGMEYLASLTRLEKLNIGTTLVGDRGLSCIAGLERLKLLYLDGTSISDAGLAYLHNLRQLHELSLGYTDVTDTGLSHLATLTSLRKLNLRGTKISDAGLAHLTRLEDLQEIDLIQTGVTEVGVRHLKALPTLRLVHLPPDVALQACGDYSFADPSRVQELDLAAEDFDVTQLAKLSQFSSLKRLDLAYTPIADQDLKVVGTLSSLEELRLEHTAITDQGLLHLKPLKNLRRLNLAETAVTDAGLAQLEGLASLRSIDVRMTQVTDAGLKHIEGLTGLEALHLGSNRVTDTGLSYLKGRTELRRLFIDRTGVTGAGLRYLEKLPSLEQLSLAELQVDDAALAHLENLTLLQVLDLSKTQVTDAGLVHLKGMILLERLTLANTQITDAGLQHLKALVSLRNLNLRNTEVTRAGVEDLQKALPACKIDA